MDDLTRAVLARAIRDHAPNRAQVGGKTVTPEDAAHAVASISDPTVLMTLARAFADMADDASIAAEQAETVGAA